MTNYEWVQRLKRREHKGTKPQCCHVIASTYEAGLARRAGVVMRCARPATTVLGLCWQHAKAAAAKAAKT